MRKLIACLMILWAFPAYGDGVTVVGQLVAAGAGYTASITSYSAVTQTAGTSVVLTAPTGIVDGDLLVAFVLFEANQATVACTGFTQIDSVAVDALHHGRSFYKVASSESGDYTWSWATETSGVSVHMYCVTKTGGTFVAPTTAGYHIGAGDTSVGVSTGNVTTQNGSILLCGFSHDATPTLDTGASGMTQDTLHEVGTMRGVAFRQTYAAGATVAKNVVWSASDRNTAFAVVCYAN